MHLGDPPEAARPAPARPLGEGLPGLPAASHGEPRASDQSSHRLSAGAPEFTGISAQSCLISPSTLSIDGHLGRARWRACAQKS